MKLFKALKKKIYLVDTIYVFLATRIPLILLALLFIGFADPGRTINFYDALSQWDGQWYLRVAREGYHWQGPHVQANVAFFPLYPLLAKILSFLVGNLELSFFIISYASFLLFLLFLYKLTEKYSGREIAFRTIWYISIFPLSLVFSIFYNESLFFMLCCGCLYFACQKRWNWAIAFGFFATLTRLSGLVLLPTLLFYFLKTHKKYKIMDLFKFLAIPLGIVLFSVYLWFKVGDPLAYSHVLSAWRVVYQSPVKTIMSVLSFLYILPRFNYFTAVGAFDLSFFTFFVIVLVLSFKRLPRELFLFSFLIFLSSVFVSWDPTFFYPMASTKRYLYEAFPLFITAAKLGENKFFDKIYTVLSLLFLGILSLAFYSGKWVF